MTERLKLANELLGVLCSAQREHPDKHLIGMREEGGGYRIYAFETRAGAISYRDREFSEKERFSGVQPLPPKILTLTPSF